MSEPSVRRAPFGSLPDGTPVSVYTLASGRGVEVRIMDYGGVVLSVLAPDREGRAEDVTLGYPGVPGYLADTIYAGALIGRYANRIARGTFPLDGRVHTLAHNNGAHHLHGGASGFHRVLWQGEPRPADHGAALALRHVSAAGHEGYPGTLAATVQCTLGPDNTLTFAFHATTDAPTPVSLTQHSYFNLSGNRAADPGGQELTIRASRYLPVRADLIPTGEQRPVDGTPFDFRNGAVIGDRLARDDDQLKLIGGFDHCFVLDAPAGGERPAARLYDRASGRVLEITTTLPALQFYSSGVIPAGHYEGRRGVALEAQQFPDAPNQPAFPSAILRPGEVYAHRIAYRFSVA